MSTQDSKRPNRCILNVVAFVAQGAQLPNLYRAIFRTGDDELVSELHAEYCVPVCATHTYDPSSRREFPDNDLWILATGNDDVSRISRIEILMGGLSSSHDF